MTPETAKLFFFSCFFFAFFAGDAVEYLYRLGVSGRIHTSQLWTVLTEGFLSNFIDLVGGCD